MADDQIAYAIDFLRAMETLRGLPGADELNKALDEIDSSDPSLTARSEYLLRYLRRQPPTPIEQRAQLIQHIRTTVAATGVPIDEGRWDNVLAALGALEREKFVHPDVAAFAYLPTALSIGQSQSISDARLVAIMVYAAELSPGAHVLDIGTGCGYQAALLSVLGCRVTSLEIVPELAEEACLRLFTLGFRNIDVWLGDATSALPVSGPFDAIIAAAGTDVVPPSWSEHLKPGGRLILPVGALEAEEDLLVGHKRDDGKMSYCSLGPVSFVPLRGQGQRDALHGSLDRVPYCYGRAFTQSETP